MQKQKQTKNEAEMELFSSKIISRIIEITSENLKYQVEKWEFQMNGLQFKSKTETKYVLGKAADVVLRQVRFVDEFS